MLKKLIILLLAVILLVPVTGFCQRQVRSLEKEPLPFVGAEDLIYGSYLNLIGWTMDNGSYSLRKKGGRMKFIRLIEVFDSPYIFCNTNIKTPKIRKIYFQVIAKSKVENPIKEDDIEILVRIVEVIMEHVDGNVKYTYYVAVDNTLSGLPNDIKDWVEIKDLKGKRLEKRANEYGRDEGAELPPGAEIVDMKWGYWLAEFIKLYHLGLMESIPSFRPGPKLREVILEELYGEESAGRFGHNPMPIDQSLLWAGIDHTQD